MFEGLGEIKDQAIEMIGGKEIIAEILASNPDLADRYLLMYKENTEDFIRLDTNQKMNALAAEVIRDGKIGQLLLEWFQHNILGTKLVETLKPKVEPIPTEQLRASFTNSSFAKVLGNNVIFTDPNATLGGARSAAAEAQVLLNLNYVEGAELVVPQSAEVTGFGLTSKYITEYRAMLEQMDPPGKVEMVSPEQAGSPVEPGTVRFVVFNKDQITPGVKAGLKSVSERGAFWSSTEAFGLAQVESGKTPEQAIAAAGIVDAAAFNTLLTP